eukprot:366438-Chlamydomonas_euryale.AAC.3
MRRDGRQETGRPRAAPRLPPCPPSQPSTPVHTFQTTTLAHPALWTPENRPCLAHPPPSPTTRSPPTDFNLALAHPHPAPPTRSPPTDFNLAGPCRCSVMCPHSPPTWPLPVQCEGRPAPRHT